MTPFHTGWRKCLNFVHHARMHLAERDLRGWWGRVQSQWCASSEAICAIDEKVLNPDLSFAILHTVETAAVAQRMSARLRSHGWVVRTFVQDVPDESYHGYFVLDLSMITQLPTGRRWCYLAENIKAPAADQQALRNSAAVLAATSAQIKHLADLKVDYLQVHYLPLPDDMGADTFDYMFDRFLFAQRLLPISVLLSNELPIAAKANAVVLSMPETIERRMTAQQMLPLDYEWFCGIRCQPGWVGCALSYRTLAQHALKHDIRRLLIVEDDALVPKDYESIMCDIQDFLDIHEGSWDVFCGMIAVLDPDTTVKSVCTYKGMMMVWIDRMTSMVCNVYATAALHRLAAWYPVQKDDVANTIDRYLGEPGQLRVIVALPFVVGHRENVRSTLWGASNRLYSASIRSAERELVRKVRDYECKSVAKS